MAIVVHHSPANKAATWSLRAWQADWDGTKVQDGPGVVAGATIDFELPYVPDPRTLQFKFHWTIPAVQNNQGSEPDDFIRRLYMVAPAEVWTFEASPRVLYQDPSPAGVVFNAGDILTFQVITQNAFGGGQLYVWNPYNSANQATSFGESARNDATGVSTFQVALQPWMTGGFNLKLMQPAHDNVAALWESNASNRVWRPCDGASLWLKSGQCDVRSQPLSLTPVPVEVMYSAELAAPPIFVVKDVIEGSSFAVPSNGSQPYAGSALFRIASYTASIYPQAGYVLESQNGVENPALDRPFPADPTVLNAVSRCALGASAWVAAFPAVRPIPITISPQPHSSFGGGVSVQVSVGNGPAYETIAARQQPDGTWQAALDLAIQTTTSIVLLPAAGKEPTPYAWINISRYFTPAATDTRFFTTEGVFGVCASGPTHFAEPASRTVLMQAAFGAPVVNAGVFAAREMPQGVTMVGGQTFFVVHAPHAISASLVLVVETAPGVQARKHVPMTLTGDTFYWWCSVAAADAPAGKLYRFLLNDNLEVLDPAARAVRDGGSLNIAIGDQPGDPSTSWSIVLDAAAAYAASHVHPWNPMGWESLLIYEIHARRFTNLSDTTPAGDTIVPFDLLTDELQPVSRLGKPGYLNQLPVKTLGLMPVSEFSSTVSWGYDPSYYFAIDGFYGGAAAMAKFVDAGHVTGRGVTLDVVYNHSLNSSLMQIAADVYSNGSYDGDRMNCGHPMMLEYFRQASVYLFRTFNLDGFRFDDTNTIITKCVGGWEFLGAIRAALRAAATAEGLRWPYCVAENNGTSPFDVSNPGYGVMDGQWGIDEVYQIKAASYDTKCNADDSVPLKTTMDAPSYWGRPFNQVTRFGESHDMVSGQDPTNMRIAARPPYRQGFQMAKALGTLTLMSNGVPMVFMGQEVGETMAFSFDDNDQWINPQNYDVSPATDNTRILDWFRQIMGLRNDASKGLQGNANYQVVSTGNRTVAFTCGSNQSLFTVVTFGTLNQQQNSSWLGLPPGSAFKEIFNSSWPVFQVEFEQEQANGGYTAQIQSGQILNLPYIGAVVLERA
jgi:1,4-alpha-glucan branching enzyme